MDRRTTLRWIVAAGAAAVMPNPMVLATGKAVRGAGYGTDPELLKRYEAGELWPLVMTDEQRRTAAVLCALIIPRDAHSPSAAELKVHEFIDEWISAPYPRHVGDRKVILGEFGWLDGEGRRRFSRVFRELAAAEQRAICDEICYVPKVKPGFVEAARFFARYRDLTASGFYTTPQGRADIKYVGNVPLARFEGPPLAALRHAGLA